MFKAHTKSSQFATSGSKKTNQNYRHDISPEEEKSRPQTKKQNISLVKKQKKEKNVALNSENTSQVN